VTDFGWALARLQEGMKVTRNGWERPGLHVRLQLDYKRSEARALVYEPRLMLHSPDGDPAEWVPVGSDLFAQDWLCASADGTIMWPDGTTDTIVKDAFPEKVADDMPWLTAGWPRLQRQPVDSEHYEALRRDVAEMIDSLRQLIARPKPDFSMQVSLPEDFDAEKVKQEFRIMLGLCRDCGKSPCVCLRSAPCPDWSHEIEHDAHEWDAPVDGHVHCPGWSPVASDDEQGQG
jgi:hypothetical protein